jgi:hypothetical protein
MNRLLALTSALGLTLLASHAFADPLAAIQAFTLNDVKAAEAVYAANPSVPTAPAATACLSYLDTTLSAAPTGSTVSGLAVPQGVASTVADLDVALNAANGGLPPVVLQFNGACGAYIEDLKAEAAAAAAKQFSLFGVIKF